MSDPGDFDDMTSLLDEYEDWTLSDTDSDDSLTLEYGKKKCHGSFFYPRQKGRLKKYC